MQRNHPLGVAAFSACTVPMALWPAKPSPLVPAGNSNLQPLIVGNLHDPATSYTWTQRMKQAFPNGHLMSTLYAGHVLANNANFTTDPAAYAGCQDKIITYFTTGALPLNGFVCHQHDLMQV